MKKIDKGIFFIFCLASLCVLLAVVAGTAKADELTHKTSVTSDTYKLSTADPVQGLIIRQLAAIKARDAQEAFALTSASIHDKYKNAKNYLGHMRFEFRSLYNHEDFQFLDRHNIGADLIQKVQITNMNNEPVLVIFKLVPDDAKSWVIDSFSVIGGEETQPI